MGVWSLFISCSVLYVSQFRYNIDFASPFYNIYKLFSFSEVFLKVHSVKIATSHVVLFLPITHEYSRWLRSRTRGAPLLIDVLIGLRGVVRFRK